MSASRKSGSKILGMVEPKEAEKLLLDWVNLPDLAMSPEDWNDPNPMFVDGPEDDSHRYFRSRYEHVLGLRLTNRLVSQLRDRLREVWDAADARTQDWYIFELRRLFHQWTSELRFYDWSAESHAELRARGYSAKAVAKATLELRKALEFRESLQEPPPVTPFEAAVFYFQRKLGHLAKHCQNPTCSEPYFLATKRWQKYCSEKCAAPALRESKREWWRQNRAKNGNL
jgi:hypothetical protein